MRRLETICVGMVLLSVTAVYSQVPNTTPNTSQQPVPAVVGQGSQDNPGQSAQDGAADNASDVTDLHMLTPPPVSGQSYPTAFTSEERSNYLRGGLAFTTAYSDNALGTLVNGHPVSDVSYSIAPLIALDETTSRTRFTASYAPGFTFYQQTSSRNEADENAAINFQYRLSPHVTFSATDSFQKSSNVFNQPDLAAGVPVSGGTGGTNFSVIAPVADRLTNIGNAGLTYQFARDSTIGGSGTFTNLHYPDPSEVPGLFDSAAQTGSVFYSQRVAKTNYLGVSYQYQRLVSYPTGGISETQTHAILLFYSVYPRPQLSLSFFGGPQYSDTVEPLIAPLTVKPPEMRAWSPAAGASLSWQGRLNSIALSYAHVVSGGGGLIGAVHQDSASASLRQQIVRNLSGSITGIYAQNDQVSNALPGTTNGHTVSGTASLQQQFGQHLSLQLGYSRIHQSYSDVAVLALTPNTNREFATLSYQFSRAIGR